MVVDYDHHNNIYDKNYGSFKLYIFTNLKQFYYHYETDLKNLIGSHKGVKYLFYKIQIVVRKVVEYTDGFCGLNKIV